MHFSTALFFPIRCVEMKYYIITTIDSAVRKFEETRSMGLLLENLSQTRRPQDNSMTQKPCFNIEYGEVLQCTVWGYSDHDQYKALQCGKNQCLAKDEIHLNVISWIVRVWKRKRCQNDGFHELGNTAGQDIVEIIAIHFTAIRIFIKIK